MPVTAVWFDPVCEKFETVIVGGARLAPRWLSQRQSDLARLTGPPEYALSAGGWATLSRLFVDEGTQWDDTTAAS
jgi:hypothetical protein